MNRIVPVCAALGLLAGWAVPPAAAGSCSGGSIISRQNAIADASSCLPPGAQITAEHCITLIRDLSPRYQCSLTWSRPAAGTP